MIGRIERSAQVDFLNQQISIQVDEGVHVVTFVREGKPPATQESVRQFFGGEFFKATADATFLVVDLCGVNSLDSSSLGPLVQKLRDTSDRHGKMVLAGVQSPALREIFALTRFDKVFPIYADRVSAVQALKALRGGV